MTFRSDRRGCTNPPFGWSAIDLAVPNALPIL